MKKLNTLGKVITKILEVFHWVGVALMIAAIICSVAAPNLVGYFVGFDAKNVVARISKFTDLKSMLPLLKVRLIPPLLSFSVSVQ